jgi:hypothetical protein
MSPRTATIEEVISTAQMAICAASKKSRRVMRRPTVPTDPDLMIPNGAILNNWRTGTRPKRIPLSNANSKAIS